MAGTVIDGPLAAHLLDAARAALDDVLRFNRTLAAELDRDRFFYSIRPSPPADFLAKIEPGSANVERFLAVCRTQGAAYAFHHHRLVKPFLEEPAATAPPDRLARLTASGPPLDVVLAGLSRLVDLRAARNRPGTAHDRLARLRQNRLSTV